MKSFHSYEIRLIIRRKSEDELFQSNIRESGLILADSRRVTFRNVIVDRKSNRKEEIRNFVKETEEHIRIKVI